MIYGTIKILILISLIAYFVNSVFFYNKTSYILIGSIFLFVFSSMLFFILELEFLAIIFSMIYVGGIAVMFLFLILVVDVNIENVEGTKLTKVKKIDCLLISIFSFVLTFILLAATDPLIFSNLDICIQNSSFSEAFKKYIECRSIPVGAGELEGLEIVYAVSSDFDYRNFFIKLSDAYFIQNYPLFLMNSIDL
jgi:NADH:ubiquinone oxidoreductase subunit 6 (subunit J)